MPEVLRTLHLSQRALYLLGFSLLVAVALVVGMAVARVLGRLAKRFQNTAGEFVCLLLQPLPVPLLLLAALYTALEVLTLPHFYERLGAKLISCLTILVVFYFPAKVVILFVHRIAARRPELGNVTRFVVMMTRALFVVLAFYTILEALAPPAKYERFGAKLTETLAIALVFYAIAKLIILYLSHMSQREPALRRVTDPAAFVVKLLFALLAIIIVLENFGVHLTAVWTTLGVGSVAVALALQETLSNLFAGLYLLADRPISPGDYIKMDSGQEGYVVRVGWRSTTIRTLQNNMVVVPNSTMAKAVIINYSTPEPRMSLVVNVGVAYGTDPNRVEKVLLEIANAAAKDGVEGLLASPQPLVRLIPGFGASTLDFSLIVQVRQFVDQYFVQHELRKRILERFGKDGIEMPFPTRTILLDDRALAALSGNSKESKP
ncbi:MAG TPA: mechanosensitive ion channel family protein [Terriglobia bacterium]|nr:mechanosensitive ion channel family protein [Terriglobia bacterium]